MILNLVITLSVGFIGGVIFLRLKVPAGAMIGSMLLVALFNILTGEAYMPQNVRIITQIAAGAFIGSDIKRKDILDIRNAIKPAALLLSGMLALASVMGFAMWKLTGIDFVTSFFACAPGGVVDMTLISQDMGADTSKVAVLQLVRLVFVISFFPPMLKLITSRMDRAKPDKAPKMPPEDSSSIGQAQSETPTAEASVKQKAVNMALTFAVALLAGIIGYLLKIPAGTMTFAMFAAAAWNIFSGRGFMPVTVRKVTQVFAGVLIGEGMSLTDVVQLKSVIFPAAILLTGFVIMNLSLGFVISKVFKIDRVTALFSSVPAGVSDMALIASELGADTPKVVVMQLARIICVISLYPVIIKLILAIAS